MSFHQTPGDRPPKCFSFIVANENASVSSLGHVSCHVCPDVTEDTFPGLDSLVRGHRSVSFREVLPEGCPPGGGRARLPSARVAFPLRRDHSAVQRPPLSQPAEELSFASFNWE